MKGISFLIDNFPFFNSFIRHAIYEFGYRRHKY